MSEYAERLYTPCPRISGSGDPNSLVTACDDCGRFYAGCCHHMQQVCHHSRVVYTDGACQKNGKYGAVSGIGFAFGMWADEEVDGDIHQFSMPVDDRLDPGRKRTNQRAELLAALEGLKMICDHDQEKLEDEAARQECVDALPRIIIAADSKYVVDGMTDWLFNWKENGMNKANGEEPANLDLFLKLEAEVKKRERRHGCQINFWHIDRTYNTIADRLAKRGARSGENRDLGSVISAMSACGLSD